MTLEGSISSQYIYLFTMKVADSHRKLSSFYGVVDHHCEVRSSGHAQGRLQVSLAQRRELQ